MTKWSTFFSSCRRQKFWYPPVSMSGVYTLHALIVIGTTIFSAVEFASMYTKVSFLNKIMQYLVVRILQNEQHKHL